MGKLRSGVESVTSFANFLTDHFNDVAGHILIKASPMLAPVPSGIVLFIALEAFFGLWPAIFVTFVVEGLGFAAVDAKNKIDAYNRTAPAAQHRDAKPAQRAIWLYFTVTLISILLFETVPHWAKWWQGDASLVDALANTAPLVFPFFANIGASIYSLMDVLQMAERTKEDALGALQAKHNELLATVASMKKDHVEALAAAAAARTQAEHLANLRLDDYNELNTKYQVLVAKYEALGQMLERADRQPLAPNIGVSEPPKPEPLAQKSRIGAPERRGEVFKRLIQTSAKGQANFAEWARTFGVSDTVIRNDLDWLKTQGYWENGNQWRPTPKGLETFGG